MCIHFTRHRWVLAQGELNYCDPVCQGLGQKGEKAVRCAAAKRSFLWHKVAHKDDEQLHLFLYPTSTETNAHFALNWSLMWCKMQRLISSSFSWYSFGFVVAKSFDNTKGKLEDQRDLTEGWHWIFLIQRQPQASLQKQTWKRINFHLNSGKSIHPTRDRNGCICSCS